MKLNMFVLTAFTLISSMFFSIDASAQMQDTQDYTERAQQEADRLQRILNLEDWQVFYVDSTLQHDLTAIMTEVRKLQAAKVNNASIYQDVQDKWLDQIDATYKKIFTEEQWSAYLRSGAGKAQKTREKRRMKTQGK